MIGLGGWILRRELTWERSILVGSESSVALARPESRESRAVAVREWPDARDAEERVGDWGCSAPGLASRSRRLRRSLLLRRF
jgi:hypothetical protein